MLALLNKLLGDPNKRRIAKHWHTVDLVNQFEEELSALSDDGLRAKTEWFKAELAQRPRDVHNTKADWKLQQEALEYFEHTRKKIEELILMESHEIDRSTDLMIQYKN